MLSFKFSVFSFQCLLSPASQSRFATHGSKLIAHSSRLRSRSGLSLIEVLASIGVVAIGLLGLASLLPVGLVTIYEATKADRAGNCGRAAMRDVVVRRMLDSSYWNGSTGTGSFLIDPLGVTNGVTGKLGGANIPRISLNYAATPAAANAIFTSTDDLITPLPEEMSPPRAPGRPLNLDASGNPAPLTSTGAYSWFASVVPTPNNPTRFTVSVVVCYRRLLNPAANQPTEQAVAVNKFWDTVATLSGGSIAAGGGSVTLAGQLGGANNIRVRENDWVALCSAGNATTPPTCRWYRVVAINDQTDTTQGYQVTLAGPDWPNPSPGSDKLVAVGQEVVGVYTTTIDLDTDATWKN